MKKSTFFLSLFLTVSGVATTNAQNTFLTPEDIKDGRVITLKGSNISSTGYMTMSKAGAEGSFDPNKTAVAVEAYENNTDDGVFYFYLKTISEGKYLEKWTNNNQRLTNHADSKDGAALFHAVKVSVNGSDDNQVTGAGDIRVDGVSETDNNAKVEKVVRFVVSDKPDGNGTAATKGYLNFDGTGTQAPQYFTGKGSYSVFSVYDAVELCKQHYNYDDIISANSTDEIYVGDFVLSADKKNAVQTAYGRYDAQFSEANSEVVTASTDDIYTEIVTASDEAAAIIYQEVFDANLYYLIKNYDYNSYMGTSDNEKLETKGVISGSASQIWHFEAVAVETESDETEAEVFKYFMFTQGVYCDAPKKSTQVTLSKAKTTSYYMINPTTGLYAFDCDYDKTLSANDNNGSGLQAKDNATVIGWGTLPDTSKWKLRVVKTYTVVMPAEGWTTLNLPFAVSLPENGDLTVLYPTDAEKYTDDKTNEAVNRVTMTPLKGNKIPADFPVVLQGKADNYTLTILPADEDVSDVSTGDREANKFEGVLLPKTVSPALLFKLEFDDSNFTLSEFEGSDVTVAANSAYMPFSSVTTGITDVVAADTNADNVWFDLVGRRVLNPAKGVYVNAAGKKALFK